MNRLFITILSFCFLANIYAQKPSKGSLATEAQMNLNLNGSFFPPNLEDNMILPTLRFRYFLSPDLALRADLNLMSAKTTTNFAQNLDGSGATGEYIEKESGYGLGLGVEKHLGGNERFSPFVGGGFRFGLGSMSTENTNSSSVAYLKDRKGTSTNKTSTLGVGAFVGGDYWINKSFYAGAQIDFGYAATTIKDGVAEVTLPGGGAPIKQTTLGGKSSGFGEGVTPSIRVGFLLNGKSGPADSDGDGVIDDLDKCPNTPKGMKVGADGCPVIMREIQSLAKNIYFETSSDVLKAESHASLDKVAAILMANPMANLSIEGHTDSQGDDAMNLDLSKRRAKSVLNYLSSKGADVSHLKAQGFGETRPVADNGTAEGRALNRRVELLLTF